MYQFRYVLRLFLITGILMMGLSGCMFGKRKVFTLEQITEYMGQKYNDTFTVKGTDLQSPFEERTLLVLYSEKLGVNIQVYYQSENSNIEEALTDNYMSYALKPDIEALLRPMAEEIYGTVKVFYYVLNSDPFEPQGPETTADQLLSSGEPIGLVVLLPPDTDQYQERGEALVQKMQEKGYYPLLTILYLNDEDAYASANSTNYNDYLVREYRLLRCDHAVEEYSIEMEWRDQNGPIPTGGARAGISTCGLSTELKYMGRRHGGTSLSWSRHTRFLQKGGGRIVPSKDDTGIPSRPTLRLEVGGFLP